MSAEMLQRFIKTACRGGPKATKGVQQQIAQYMQDWIAAEINRRLENRGFSKLNAESKGHRFCGGWRGVSVDVHVSSRELGLVLAMDPKHLQSAESIKKNWKNALNDLVAFAGNLHARFPMCVVGGIFGFERSQVSSGLLKDMYGILRRVEQQGQLDVCGIVVYECGPPRLSLGIPPKGNCLRIEEVLDRAIELLAQRYVP